MEQTKIIGKAFKATLVVMGELGSLGQELLSSHGIKEIDVDKLYRRLEEILKNNRAASAEEIAAAMKHDFAAWQGTNARRDDVTAVVFRL